MCYKGRLKNKCFKFWLADSNPPIFALPKIAYATKGNRKRDGAAVFYLNHLLLVKATGKKQFS